MQIYFPKNTPNLSNYGHYELENGVVYDCYRGRKTVAPSNLQPCENTGLLICNNYKGETGVMNWYGQWVIQPAICAISKQQNFYIVEHKASATVYDLTGTEVFRTEHPHLYKTSQSLRSLRAIRAKEDVLLRNEDPSYLKIMRKKIVDEARHNTFGAMATQPMTKKQRRATKLRQSPEQYRIANDPVFAFYKGICDNNQVVEDTMMLHHIINFDVDKATLAATFIAAGESLTYIEILLKWGIEIAEKSKTIGDNKIPHSIIERKDFPEILEVIENTDFYDLYETLSAVNTKADLTNIKLLKTIDRFVYVNVVHSCSTEPVYILVYQARRVLENDLDMDSIVKYAIYNETPVSTAVDWYWDNKEQKRIHEEKRQAALQAEKEESNRWFSMSPIERMKEAKAVAAKGHNPHFYLSDMPISKALADLFVSNASDTGECVLVIKVGYEDSEGYASLAQYERYICQVPKHLVEQYLKLV